MISIRLILPGLKLPSINVVLRQPYFVRTRRMKAMRERVVGQMMAQNLGGIIPARSCNLKITVLGPYQRDPRHSYDTNNIYVKDLIDALIAKPLYSRSAERRMGIDRDDYRRLGLIVDDSSAVIGAPVVVLEDADEFEVVVEVTAKN